jgi:hypothetical protein
VRFGRAARDKQGLAVESDLAGAAPEAARHKKQRTRPSTGAGFRHGSD